MAKTFASSYNSINVVIRFILTLFLDVILGAIYRISRGHVVAGIVWFFTVGLLGIGWIVDLVTTVLNNKYTLFA